MTDKPPRTALDRLRAGLRRRNDATPAAGEDRPTQPAGEPHAPTRGETVEPPPADAPLQGPAIPPPQGRQALPPDEPEAAPAREPPAAAPEPPWPRPDPEIVELRRTMRVTIDSLKIVHEEQLSRTRLRINLRWAAAVMLGVAMIAGTGYAGYSYLSHNREELFQRHWPWRAHVWNNYGDAVIWCINEAHQRGASTRRARRRIPFTAGSTMSADVAPIASGSSSEGTGSTIAARPGKP
ncbi:MAG: hypothetical protein OXN81_06290, partial [Alphaproteobacteria bacterium]|nr:hypothetical protein [Alphaproteobacteria bacterium]